MKQMGKLEEALQSSKKFRDLSIRIKNNRKKLNAYKVRWSQCTSNIFSYMPTDDTAMLPTDRPAREGVDLSN